MKRTFVFLCFSLRSESRRWDLSVTNLSVNGHPLTMAFHSYDQHLIIANEHDMIRYACSSMLRTTLIKDIRSVFGTGIAASV